MTTSPAALPVVPRLFHQHRRRGAMTAAALISVLLPAAASAKDIGDAQLRGLGVEATAVMPFGTLAPVVDPSFGVRGAFTWPVWAHRLAVGVVAGWEKQTGASTDVNSGSLRLLTAAVRTQAILGSRNWGTVPFVGMDVGAAHVSMHTMVDMFSQSEEALAPSQIEVVKKSMGVLVTPECGLWSTLPHGISLRLSVYYQTVFTTKELPFGSLRTNAVTGAGLSAGVFYRFQ